MEINTDVLTAPRPINNHAARTKMAAPAATSEDGRGRGELIMSVACGGNRAVTFPDRSDIPAIRLVPARLRNSGILSLAHSDLRDERQIHGEKPGNVSIPNSRSAEVDLRWPMSSDTTRFPDPRRHQ